MSDKIKIDNGNFYDMEKWEMTEILSTTHLNFFGLTLQQHPTAIRKLNQLLHFGDFARVIEIGDFQCQNQGKEKNDQFIKELFYQKMKRLLI